MFYRYKHVVKNIAEKHNAKALFLSKPYPKESGCSSHFNHSLWDLSKKNNTETAEKPALRLRKLLDRVDVVGYGPTHPRVAAVVVGDSSDSEKVITTVESIFRYGTKSKGSVCCCFMEEYTHQLCTETQIGTDCSLCV